MRQALTEAGTPGPIALARCVGNRVSTSLKYAAGRDLLIEVAPTPSQEAAALRAAKAKAKHRVDMLALEYAEILMQKKITEALDPATDARLRRDLANDIINRGIGKVPEAPHEDDGKKQPVDAETILDVLAAMSTAATAVEAAQRQLGHTRTVGIEKDVTPRLEGNDLVGDWSVNKLFDDIEKLEEDGP